MPGVVQCILDYPTPRLSERFKLVTAHVQSIKLISRWRPLYSSVCSQRCYGLFTMEQKRKNAALSVECKLFFFTMEILRMPRVLFLALFNYPNTSIESAAWSCLDNRGCTVYGKFF